MSWWNKRAGDPRPEYARGLPRPETYADLAPDAVCFATTRISRDGALVGYMILNAPDGDGPARWDFFAGDETQAFVDDPDNTHMFSLNTIANHDRSIIPYLDAPAGSVWVKDCEGFRRAADLTVVDGQAMFPCRCCGFLTLEHPANGSYDICPVCSWEDDPVQNDEPFFAGGANGPSLMDARDTFRRIGAIEERLLPHTRAPLPAEIPEVSPPALNIIGETVTQVRFDHAFTLLFSNGAMTRLECPVSVRESVGALSRIPAGMIAAVDRTVYLPVMSLLDQTVSAAAASPSGELAIMFGDGSAIVCAPDPDYEAWEYSEPTGRLIVATPGGGLAEFPATR